MHHLRSVLALLVVATLALAACGDDDDTATDADTESTAPVGSDSDSDDSDSGGSDSGDDAAPTDLPELEPFEAPDGAAATIGDVEIASATIEELYNEIAQSPQIAEMLGGEEGDVVASSLRAQVLTELVVFEILSQAAGEDFGVTVSDDDLGDGLAAMEETAGGAEELDAQLEMSGLTRNAFLQVQLPLTVLLQQLEPEFGDLSSDPDAEDPSELSEGQAALQEWGTAQFADAQVSVAPEYGTWNSEAAQVVPEGMPTAPSIEE